MSNPLPTIAFREGASDRVNKLDLVSLRNHFQVAEPWKTWLAPELAYTPSISLGTTNGWNYIPLADSGTPVAHWVRHVPTYWPGGTIGFTIYYTVSTGTSEQFRINFEFQGAVDGVDLSTGSDLSDEQTVTFSGTGASYLDSYTSTANATISAGDTVFRVSISRDSADAADTSTSDFRLHGVLLNFSPALT